MALEDVYFPIAGNPKIFGISTNDGGEPEGKETKSKTVTINCNVGQELTFYFDTKDATANNGLQGTFKLNTTDGRIEFFSEKLEQAVSEFKIPEEPTVQEESSYETHTILIRLKEGYENISIDSVSFTAIIIYVRKCFAGATLT